MTMRLFATTYNPQFRSRIVLSGVALAALALSLLLAYAVVMLPHWQQSVRAQASLEARILLPTAQALAPPPPAARHQTAPRVQQFVLSRLLAPWVLIVDAIAAVGFVAMVFMWRR